ncbi:hypothetical protein [Streptomyces sp. NPDC017991]|uniref:hypothetical protein n=1 Tax=Streptomyces sp. NPDC017991 TaxID=3365026 RepID=UPI0037897802
MSDLPDLHSATVDAIVDHAGRSTLPFQQANREEQHATAFWFNELVETSADGEVVRQYLVTAGEPTRVELAEFTLRPDLCTPAMSAEKLMLIDFAQGWTHLDDLGVAVMPTAGLHAHGARKGWRWAIDEITDGIAATEQDIVDLGDGPVAAYLLGHVADGDGTREQAVVVGEITRTGNGGIRWNGDLPQGCVGAPVFIGARLGGDGHQFKLVCVGVAVHADGQHAVVPFDRVRAALAAFHSDRSTNRSTNRSTDETALTVEPRRRWWWRRG